MEDHIATYELKEERVCSDFLFPKPSILYGFSRLLDLYALLDCYNFSATPREADIKALHCDWMMIGDDFRSALESYVSNYVDNASTADHEKEETKAAK